jgi:hypothetical protein
LLKEVALLYADKFDIFLVTSNLSAKKMLASSNDWIMQNKARYKPLTTTGLKNKNNSKSKKLVCSFKFKNDFKMI